MKLNQVEIRNFRCFEELSVSLEPDVTAIIGINAAGKTALLDAIALSVAPLFEHKATDVTHWDFHQALEGSGGPSADEVRLGLTTTLDASEPQDSEAEQRVRWRQEWVYGNGDQPSPGNVSGELEWLEPHGIDRAPLGLWRPKHDGSPGRHFAVPTIAYHRDGRNCRTERQASPKDGLHRDRASSGALDAGADFDAAQQWFYTRENEELRAGREQGDTGFQLRELKAIRAALRLMLDDPGMVTASGDPPRMRMEKRGAGGDKLRLEFRQLSAGQRGLMALTLDFARRLALSHPAWDQPLEAPGVLLIDEIELNLHPKWQQTVIPHLRRVFPDTQIIVATHSPLVLSTLHARQVRVLRENRLFAPSVETYGTQSDRVQRQVMETETTPPENDFSDTVARLYAHIDNNELDGAEVLLGRLEAERGTDEPTLIRARMLVANRRWEKELGL
jgi:predicted ATP-binding protein involved in virulence